MFEGLANNVAVGPELAAPTTELNTTLTTCDTASSFAHSYSTSSDILGSHFPQHKQAEDASWKSALLASECTRDNSPKIAPVPRSDCVTVDVPVRVTIGRHETHEVKTSPVQPVVPETTRPQNDDGRWRPTSRLVIHDMKVIVNYIPTCAREDDLRELFSQAGPVQRVTLVRNRDNGHDGFGFVTFGTKEAAKKALQMFEGYEWGDKRLKVSPSRPQSDTIKGANLYVRNIPPSYTEVQVYDLFSVYGSIIHVKILGPATSADIRRSGFVRYDKRAEAEAAVAALNGQVIEGSRVPLSVNFAIQKKGSEGVSSRQTAPRGSYSSVLQQSNSPSTMSPQFYPAGSQYPSYWNGHGLDMFWPSGDSSGLPLVGAFGSSSQDPSGSSLGIGSGILDSPRQEMESPKAGNNNNGSPEKSEPQQQESSLEAYDSGAPTRSFESPNKVEESEGPRQLRRGDSMGRGVNDGGVRYPMTEDFMEKAFGEKDQIDMQRSTQAFSSSRLPGLSRMANEAHYLPTVLSPLTSPLHGPGSDDMGGSVIGSGIGSPYHGIHSSCGSPISCGSPYASFSDTSLSGLPPPHVVYPQWTPEQVTARMTETRLLLADNVQKVRTGSLEPDNLPTPKELPYPTSNLSCWRSRENDSTPPSMASKMSTVQQQPKVDSTRPNASEEGGTSPLFSSISQMGFNRMAQYVPPGDLSDMLDSSGSVPTPQRESRSPLNRESEQRRSVEDDAKDKISSQQCGVCQQAYCDTKWEGSCQHAMCTQCFNHWKQNSEGECPICLSKRQSLQEFIMSTETGEGDGRGANAMDTAGDGDGRSITIFVHNFGRDKEDKHILRLFGEHARILSVDIIKNPRTGRHKGYAFVKVANETGASRLIQRFNGYEWEGRIIGVERKKKARPLNPAATRQHQFISNGTQLQSAYLSMKENGASIAQPGYPCSVYPTPIMYAAAPFGFIARGNNSASNFFLPYEGAYGEHPYYHGVGRIDG